MTNKNFKLALLLLMLGGLLLRIFVSADFFLHPWDERYHALVAKNLIQHPLIPTLYDNPIFPFDYQNWPGNHIWLHKQPMPLWVMSASLWLFGINEIALRLPSILMTTIGIGLTFYIASYYFNKKVGFLAAFFFSINGLIIELTGGRIATDHFDVHYLFYIELAVFFTILFVKSQKTTYNLLAGISIGLAILTKWLPALIVFPIWLLLILDSQNFDKKQIVKHLLLLTATCVLISLPWQLYIYTTFPLEASWTASLNMKHITSVLEGRDGPFYYFLDIIRINYGDLIYIPFLWFLWKMLKNRNDKKRLSILIWVLIPILFFSMAQTKMKGYILFTSPALFMMTSEFWDMLSEYRKSHKPKWLYTLILILLIALPVRYTIERVKPFKSIDRSPSWITNLKDFNKLNINNGVLLNYDKPIEAMFYTNLTVYSHIPDKKQINDLKQKGYTVIINDDGNIPDEIINIEGIMIRKLDDQIE